MVNSIQRQPDIREETRFSLLTTDEAIRNRGSLTLKKLRKDYIMLLILKIFKRASAHFREFLQTIVTPKLKLDLM